jgi:5'-nucleotidase
LKILICNDDGYQAEGLIFLQKYFSERGHEVCVVAPYKEQSGKSQSITIADGMMLIKEAENFWVLDGTPTDCVTVGLCGLLPVKPDLVISGINLGYNIGMDTLYSGTVSVAKEAVIHGCPAIAFSSGIAHNGEDTLGVTSCHINYEQISKFLDKHFDSLVQAAKTHPKNNRHLINVNFPGGTKPFAGIKRCIPSKQTRYRDEIVTFKSPVGKEYVWIKGELCEHDDKQLTTDIAAIRAGYVSVSAINVLPEDSLVEISL